MEHLIQRKLIIWAKIRKLHSHLIKQFSFHVDIQKKWEYPRYNCIYMLIQQDDYNSQGLKTTKASTGTTFQIFHWCLHICKSGEFKYSLTWNKTIVEHYIPSVWILWILEMRLVSRNGSVDDDWLQPAWRICSFPPRTFNHLYMFIDFSSYGDISLLQDIEHFL